MAQATAAASRGVTVNRGAAATSSANRYAAAGFQRADQPTKKRLIISVSGVEKSGKTHFALSAPPPIGVINLDIGLDGVVQKWQGEREIYVMDVRVNVQELKGVDIKDAASEADKAYKKLVKAYKEVLGDMRSIVWDNATEVWELLRMARFGKLDHVKPHHYAPVNAEYRELLRMAYDQDKTNLILLHKVKDEYANDQRTGKRVRAGFSDTGFLVQCNATAWRDYGSKTDGPPPVPDCFHLSVDDCRQNAELSGMDISGADLNFPALAALIFPDTVEEDWI